jgi:hypothetical protein
MHRSIMQLGGVQLGSGKQDVALWQTKALGGKHQPKKRQDTVCASQQALTNSGTREEPLTHQGSVSVATSACVLLTHIMRT